MKNLLFLLFLFLLTSCSYEKKTFWCGDHPCINKVERESYFKKNMSVEVKKFNKKDKLKKSEIDEILKQVKMNEKKRILTEKQIARKEKLDKKNKLKEEKLYKKNKLNEEKIEKKRRKKAKKMLAKQNIKKTKYSKKNRSTLNKITNKESKNRFTKLVEKIKIENMFRPYPDINVIPK